MALAARARAGNSNTPFNIADFGTADGGLAPLLTSVVGAVRAAEPRADRGALRGPGDERLAVGVQAGARRDPRRPGDVHGRARRQRLRPRERHVVLQAVLPAGVDRPRLLRDGDALADGAAGGRAARRAARRRRRTRRRRRASRRRRRPTGAPPRARRRAQERRPADGRQLCRRRRRPVPRHRTGEARDAPGLLGAVARGGGDAVHAATNFPNEYRPLSACVAPFEAGGRATAAGSCCSRRSATSSSARSSTRRAGVVDAAEQARRFVPTTRTWSNSTFVAGAVASGHAPAEAAAMADEMFAHFEARVAEDPGNRAMDYVPSTFTRARREAGRPDCVLGPSASQITF